MMKNILLGALAGAAVAFVLVEKKKHKNMEEAYHHLGDYLGKVRQKMMDGFEKGKHKAECMGHKASGMIHSHMKN